MISGMVRVFGLLACVAMLALTVGCGGKQDAGETKDDADAVEVTQEAPSAAPTYEVGAVAPSEPPPPPKVEEIKPVSRMDGLEVTEFPGVRFEPGAGQKAVTEAGEEYTFVGTTSEPIRALIDHHKKGLEIIEEIVEDEVGVLLGTTASGHEVSLSAARMEGKTHFTLVYVKPRG